MEITLTEAFAGRDSYTNLTCRWFEDMFTLNSDPVAVAAVIKRPERLPREIGEKVLIDLVHYDVGRLATALVDLLAPVMAIQTTYSNKKRERRSMSKGQMTPYLHMLTAQIPSTRIEIIVDTGHFPQIDKPTQTNMLLDSFIATLPAG
jgi:hypothetical protein